MTLSPSLSSDDHARTSSFDVEGPRRRRTNVVAGSLLPNDGRQRPASFGHPTGARESLTIRAVCSDADYLPTAW